ncbi:transposase (plasmid) [Bacillus cereus]|uniref:transposase n=1 Tax=Bacillus cereus TaxID=1396 RepID=UPI001F25D8A6|nr:transposase [Bacillus cereus]UIJ69813.1 transposase [Bacillus cereus]
MFLCGYLVLEQLRKEIHYELKTVESWHSATDFMFMTKMGKYVVMSSKNKR